VPALNARPASQLDEWLAQITEELASYARSHPHAKVAPFAVNQIVHASKRPARADMRSCVKYRVPIVITSCGRSRGGERRAWLRWNRVS